MIDSALLALNVPPAGGGQNAAWRERCMVSASLHAPLSASYRPSGRHGASGSWNSGFGR